MAGADNERLAFLGDACLALVVAEHLWRRSPPLPVGVLTPRGADVVSQANLARWAERVGLGHHLRLGRGEADMGGAAKESVLATALEAVLGVVYLEGGLDAGGAAVIAALALWYRETCVSGLPAPRGRARSSPRAIPEAVLALLDLARAPAVDDVLTVAQAGARGQAFVFGGDLLVAPGRALRLLEPRLQALRLHAVHRP